MKKFLALLFFLGALFISNTYAATIGDVALRFCNNSGSLEKTISLTTSGQEQKEICMMLINGSYEPTDVSINFVDGTITNDADQKKACKNEGENQNFGQYMTLENKTISVPARGNTTFTGVLELPEEAAGEIHGCVTYFINNEKNQKEMFTIMVRRANFIDIFAKGIVTIGLEFVDIESPTKSISKNPKLVSFFDTKENKLYIQSMLRNKGTAEQGITIKGEIKNRFGYKKTFFEEKRTIFSKQTSNINNVIDDLPFYKGPFTITYSVEHSANVSEGLETDTEEKTGILAETTSILIITPATYISVLVFLLIIAGISFFIIRRKHKKTKTAHTTNHKGTKKHHKIVAETS
ncbi:hypothetical protein P148_SR1C00001G0691 [candidate division SR1 bacterium RAAC1_SR1_1]|nr:hypothetical protein P148_SR1C00001G0691 [candidate division SR1 bacterium RAAC1_SR1_1]